MILAFLVLAAVLVYLYVRLNDYKLTRIPHPVLAISPTRTTPEDIRRTAERLEQNPISISDQLPPKTGRRYIVVGGAGFLGGWVVVKLLERGEDPRQIRVLDIRPPVRHDLTTGPAKQVSFLLCDISDPAAVDAAFNAPWPDSSSPLTVIHTAANIRFYEHHPSLLPLSTRVNVDGTQNIINASRAAGATVLVYTSSGSISVRRTRFLLWPWESEPRHFVQAINDDDRLIPTRHEHFFSNYAVSKAEAERRVRAADRSVSADGTRVLRTGCIRPSNGVFGPGGDMLCGAYLVRQTNPTWTNSVVQNFIYVENAALAHLLYEQRLLELERPGGNNPAIDIGGQAFCVCDPGAPPTYGDVYATLTTLTDGATVFPFLSPTLMIFIAQAIQLYYLTRLRLPSPLHPLLPALPPSLALLQPPLFNLVNPHLLFDDSRARLPPSRGGLGYRGGWSTLEGVHRTVGAYKDGEGATNFKGREEGAGVWFLGGGGKGRRGAVPVVPVVPVGSEGGEEVFETRVAN